MAAQGQGRLLANRYRLRAELGRGGMGTVWRAHDELLDREVAVKEVLLPPGLGPEERDVLYKRTFREARASARLNHPSVVTVHDVVSEGERPWIVMELVQARSLQEVLDAEGPLQPRSTAEIGRQVLAALSHAHRAGILHRDVKPSNVLVCEDDRAVLTDFGIAQMEGDATLTQTGLVMGSPAYIPPERVKGERAVPASDLWALGATLYTCVEGKAPYERSDAMAALAAALSEEVPPPRNAGPLRPVLDGLLTRDPADRMSAQTAQAMLTEIAATRPAVPVAAAAPGAPVKSQAVSPAASTVLDEPDHEALETVQDPSALQILPSPKPETKQPRPETGQPRPETQKPRSQLQQPGPEVQQPRAMPQTGEVAPPAETLMEARTERQLPQVQNPLPWQPAPPPYQPYTLNVAPPKRDHHGKAVFIVLALAVVIAIALVVGAYLLRTHNNAGSSGSSGSSGGGQSSSSGQNSSGSTDAYETQRGDTFTVSVPKGWSREVANNGALDFVDPGKMFLLEVDPTGWTGTPLDNATKLAAAAPNNTHFPGYRQVSNGVVPRDYADGNAADWEFTFNGANGELQHARDRFFAKGGHQYALYFRAPDSQWATALPYLQKALDTFATT